MKKYKPVSGTVYLCGLKKVQCCYICDKHSSIAPVRLYCKHSHVGTWRRRPWGIVSWPRILLTATVSLFSFPNFRKLVTSSTNGRWPISCSITFFPFTHCNRIHSVFLFFIGGFFYTSTNHNKLEKPNLCSHCSEGNRLHGVCEIGLNQNAFNMAMWHVSKRIKKAMK